MDIKLETIFRGVSLQGDPFSAHDRVTQIATDSRQVRSGALFIALPSVQGKDITPFIEEAVQRGATGILKEKTTPLPSAPLPQGVKIFETENVRLACALIAANLYPTQPGQIVGVTGTNGKTSVTFFLHQMWQKAGYRSACLGTLGLVEDVEAESPGHQKTKNQATENLPAFSLTSPDPFTLHQILNHLAEKKIDHVALEASSHGIQQDRLSGVTFTAGAFTNLSHDHLDYHGNLQAYFDAKKRFFSEILPGGSSVVLNADEVRFHPLLQVCKDRGHQIVSYGRQGREITLEAVEIQEHSQRLTLRVLGKPYQVSLPLVGVFQAYNVLCALGLALITSTAPLNPEVLLSSLSTLKNVPGRLEKVGTTSKKGMVYVDYAHTPDALESVLKSLRPHIQGALSVVFGCGGNRDVAKRPLMGAIAQEYADKVYITDDNPRSEQPCHIRRQILQGCPEGIEIRGRAQAIETAITNLNAHEALVIAGKGHETVQTLGDQHIPFDDRQVAREVLMNMKGSLEE